MKRFTSLLLSALCFTALSAQSPYEAYQDYDLFAEEAPLEVELNFDYKAFLKNKNKDEYQAAIIRVTLDDSTSISDTIRMKARGEFRKRYCGFPPIKLNFKKAEFPVPAIAELEKIKLVTHCKNGKTFQQYIFKEYLSYKALNKLTNNSLRVRLVHLTYVDSKGKKTPFERYGFLIEDIEQMADRVNAMEIEREGIHPEWTDRKTMTQIALFEFMIGNTDWSVSNLHNVKLIQDKDVTTEPKVYVIPYDFDYSGIVNAIYAIPHESLNLKTVRDRIYMGYERSPAELQAEINYFLAKKMDIISLFEESPYLDASHKRESISYLEGFFSILENPKRIRLTIMDYAKKP